MHITGISKAMLAGYDDETVLPKTNLLREQKISLLIMMTLLGIWQKSENKVMPLIWAKILTL